MTIKKILTSFNGGIANNSKSGLQNAARFMRFMDIYSDADSITLSPAGVRDDGGVVTDLIMWAVDTQPYATDKYFFGNTGNLYKRTSAGAWSLVRTVSGSSGQGLAVLNDYLYYSGSTTLGRYGPLSQTPVFSDDFLNIPTVTIDLDNSTNSGQSYSVPTSIAESASNLCAFIPTKDPLARIDLYFNGKGTGDITLTVHDSANNTLGALTKVNANVNAGTLQGWIFATPIRMVNGQTYHFHITSTVADATLNTGTAASLASACFKSYFGVLLSDVNYHMIIPQAGGNANTIIIANERYIAQYDGTTYNPNKIVTEQGYKIRGFTRQNEFAVAYSWKGSNIDDFEYGRLYFWDGYSPYFNYQIDLTQGMPNAIVNTKTRLFGIFGSSGDLALATDATSPLKQLQPLPQLASGKTIEVLPGAIGLWQRRVRFGAWSKDDSTKFEAGIYEFGNQSDRAINWQSVSTESLNYFAKISTGTTKSTTLQIGCVFPAGKDLYVSWKDNASYGIDKISKTNNPSPTGSWESLIIDEGIDIVTKQAASLPQKTKNAVKMVVTFAALPTGCTVTPKFRTERATSWTSGSSATAGASRAELDFNGITGLRYREIEIGFDVTATVNYPVITSVYFEYDPLPAEVYES